MTALLGADHGLFQPALDVSLNGELALNVRMREAFDQLDHARLRDVLIESLDAEQAAVHVIAHSFDGFLAGCQAPDIRRRFFASWQRTNNSAMSASFFSGPRHRCTTLFLSAICRMIPWALALACQKSGLADCSSRAAISFSLPRMSKILQRAGYPVLQIFELVR